MPFEQLWQFNELTVSKSGIGRGGLEALAQQLLVVVPSAVALVALHHPDGKVAVR